MPHETSAATIHGFDRRSFKCAYHAKVMKTFDATSNRLVFRTTGIVRPPGRRGRRTVPAPGDVPRGGRVRCPAVTAAEVTAFFEALSRGDVASIEGRLREDVVLEFPGRRFGG